MIKYALFSFLLIVPMLGFAQSNFQSGYVVTNSKDTLKGFIDYKERKATPRSIDFRSDRNGRTKVYQLDDCIAYGIDGQVYYQRFVVNVSLSEVEISKLSYEENMAVQRDTVFLRVLQEGKNLSLYVYTDQLKRRYYIKNRDAEEPIELIQSIYLNGEAGNAIVKNNKYQRQLLLEMKRLQIGTPAEQERILQLDYREAPLLKVCATINGQELQKPKLRSTRLFAGLGVNMSRASYSGEHALNSPNAKSKNSALPMATAGLDLFVNPAIGKLIFRTELSVAMNKNEVSIAGIDNWKSALSHKFDLVNVALTPQFIYNVYNTSKLKCFFGLGLGLNLVNTTKNTFSFLNSLNDVTTVMEDGVIIEKFSYSFQGMAGVVLNKKIEIAAGYSPGTAITNYSYFNVGMERFRLGINYLFGKK